MKPAITRDMIYSIARNSNWRAAGIEAKLKQSGVYASPSAWSTFTRMLLLGSGACFVAAGIVFFFAFNWDAIHKFAKLGMLQAFIIGATAFYLFSKFDEQLKNIILTVNAVLVGVLFAVYGQIYQTGANAYDFFLSWTCAIALWVLVSRFRPLWLLFVVLLNTTLILYASQVATHWSGTMVTNILFAVNAAVVLVYEMLSSRWSSGVRSRWFPRVIGLAAMAAITGSIIMGMFNGFKPEWWLSVLLAVVAFVAGLWNGFKAKEIFYLSAIPFSLIIIMASFILRLAGDDSMFVFLFASLFIIISITFLIRNLLQLKSRWHEK